MVENIKTVKMPSMRKRKKITLPKVLIYFFLFFMTLLALYPVLYVLSMSFSSEEHLILRDVYFFPKGLTLDSYATLFETNDIWVAYGNTIVYTSLGTFIGLSTTVMLSYAVSQKKFRGRKIVIWTVLITMFFSGGMVPTYILVQGLGLLDTAWAIVLPGVVNAWNMIVARTYFSSLTPAVFESADIDGAGEFRKLFLIAIPLAKPIVAVLFMYLIVGFWNTYFTSMIYLSDTTKQPIQNYLNKLLSEGDLSGNTSNNSSSAITLEKMKYAAIVVAMLPIMMVYPFIQKYFVYGIMVGSVKE